MSSWLTVVEIEVTEEIISVELSSVKNQPCASCRVEQHAMAVDDSNTAQLTDSQYHIMTNILRTEVIERR